MAASRPPVTASGMFQRCSGSKSRLRPAPAKKTTIAIVNVRSPGGLNCRHRGSIPRATRRRDRGTPRPLCLSLRRKQAGGRGAPKGSARQAPLDAVAGVVEPRSERAESALPRRNRHDSAADAALARKPDFVKPVPRRLVKACRRHNRQECTCSSPRRSRASSSTG